MTMTTNEKPIPPVPPRTTSKHNNSKATPVAVKYYLIAFNIVSCMGWTYLLALTLIHLFNLDGSTPNTSTLHTKKTASSILSRFFSAYLPTAVGGSASIESRLPSLLRPIYRRSMSTYDRVGTPTAFVQSLAILEVVHVLLGWVRSPLGTTAAQVASRLFLVWGIVEQFSGVRSNPFYTSMIISWSLAEIVRYSYYACNLSSLEPYVLLYLRYTTFYLLYLTGASSEAALIYATLPGSSPLPSWSSWIHGMWKPADYFRGAMFVIWWPSLYVLYTYMIRQRRKVLGRGVSLRSKGAKAN